MSSIDFEVFTKNSVCVLGILAGVIGGALLLFFVNGGGSADTVEPVEEAIVVEKMESLSGEAESARTEELENEPDPQATSNLIAEGLSPQEQWEAQKALRDELLGLPQDEAVTRILDYLASGHDQSFKLPFKVGKGGWLVAAPTMRVWLLDILEEVDRSTAMQYAEDIFEKSEMSDEWAIALRSAALGRESDDGILNNADREYIKSRAFELLRNSDWESSPSAGYLESYDVVPYLGDSDLLSEVAVQLHDPKLGQAAFITVNKTVTIDSSMISEVVPKLREAQISSDVVGQLMALSDPSDVQQREGILRWFLREDTPAEEKKAFLGKFPTLGLIANYSLYDTTDRRGAVDFQRRQSDAIGLLSDLRNVAKLENDVKQLNMAIRRLD